jgi:putative spermidine/putrescine transport system ATP-binding protein
MDRTDRRLLTGSAGSQVSGLRLQNVTKRFGTVTAVDDVDLAVPAGSFVCLLGPSGCGKTTLLRIIAGLETADAGRVILDGDDVTDLPPERRDFGMVFQSLALFPHLTVAENVAYPLKLAKVPRREREARVAELLETVRLPGLGARTVSALSGGQRQRVAIARALARSPRLFLLDEPLSALDAKLREAMQVELRQLQQRLGITTITVTHDQREAMTMADLVVVMGEGRIRQAAAPVEIYRRPVDAFVADFIGSTNLLPVRRDRSGAAVLDGIVLPGVTLPEGAASATLCVRPEDIHLAQVGAAPLTGTIAFIRDLGASIEVFLDLAGGERLTAALSPRERPGLHPGERVGIILPDESCQVLPS